MLKFSINLSDKHQIKDHLLRMDTDFQTTVNSRVDLDEYAEKVATKATRFELFDNENLVALIAGYINQEAQFIFVTLYSIEKEYRGTRTFLGLYGKLLKFIEERNANELVIKEIHAESDKDRHTQILVWKRLGFKELKRERESVFMVKEV